eukprot:6205622-Pleurochrysis_carterae.AAC.1
MCVSEREQTPSRGATRLLETCANNACSRLAPLPLPRCDAGARALLEGVSVARGLRRAAQAKG